MFSRFRLFRPSLKQVALSGLGGGIGVIGAMFAVALYVVEQVTRPNKRGMFDEYTFSPYELDLPAENITFSPIQGDYKISGWFASHPEATTTILVCPGYRSRKSELLGISKQLWKDGHNVLIFDFYGHGSAVKTTLTLGYREMNDFLGALVYVKEHAPHTRLGVLAYSMGAAIAIMCAARDKAIEALVGDSAFATHWSAIDYNIRRAVHLPAVPFVWLADNLMWWRAKYHFNQVQPLRDIGEFSPRPILLIHGGQDTIVDPRDATLLFNAAKEPKELWFLPEAGHCGAYFEDRIAYTKKVLSFFDLALKKPHLQLVENMSDKEQEGVSQLPPKIREDLSEAS
nr:alpha/beta hydrolase [Ktedonobacteraceae bacterium]